MNIVAYSEKVEYLKCGTLPRRMNATQRANFKRTMKQYGLDHRFRLHFGSRRVLHEEEVSTELKLLHVELNHCNRDVFIRAVRARFSFLHKIKT